MTRATDAQTTNAQSTLRRAPSIWRVALWIAELLPALLFAAVYFQRAERVSWRPWVLHATSAVGPQDAVQVAFAGFFDNGRTLEMESWKSSAFYTNRQLNHHGWHRIDMKSRVMNSSQVVREASLLNPHSTNGSAFNGALLAQWNADQTSPRIQLWDISEGALKRRRLAKITASGLVRAVVGSPDSNLLAIAVENRCEVRDVRSGMLRFTMRAGDTWDIRWSPDGQTIATVGSALRLWDARDGRPRGKAWLSSGYPDATGVGFSADGKIVAVIDGTGNLQLRRARDATLIQRIRFNALSGPLLFSPDGRLLACGESSMTGNKSTHIFDVATASHRRTLQASGAALSPVAWSPDGTHLVTRAGALYENQFGAVVVWRVRGWNAPQNTSSVVNLGRAISNADSAGNAVNGY